MNSYRFIANPSLDALNHNECFITRLSRQTSEMGQWRRFNSQPVTSGLHPTSDMVTAGRDVLKVSTAEISISSSNSAFLISASAAERTCFARSRAIGALVGIDPRSVHSESLVLVAFRFCEIRHTECR
jgi:hypothetical protein